MKKTLIIILLITFCLPTNGEIQYIKWSLLDDSTTNQKTIEQAIFEYFSLTSKTTNVRILSKEQKLWRFSIVDRLSNFFFEKSYLPLQINVQNLKFTATEASNNFWYIDSHWAFEALLSRQRTSDGKDIVYFIVILDILPDLIDNEIQSILETAFNNNIVDIIVITYLHSKYLIYSYQAFGENYCREVHSRVVNVFENGTIGNLSLFSRNINNFYNCELRFILQRLSPWIDYKKFDNGSLQVFGIEGKLIEMLAKKLNFRPTFVHNEGENWGDVDVKGKTNGGFTLLKNKLVDILLGGYGLTINRLKYYSSSNSYVSSYMVAIIKQPPWCQRISPYWFFESFELSVYLFYILCLILLIILVTTIRKVYSHKYVQCHRIPRWLDVFGLSIGITRNVWILNRIFRMCIIIWSFAYLILNAAYQGQLYVGYNKIPKCPTITLDMLSQRNYTLVIDRTRAEMPYIKLFKYNNNRRIILNSTEYEANFEYILKYPQNLLTLGNELKLMEYIENHNAFQLIPIRERVFFLPVVTYFRKNSYFFQSFKKILSYTPEIGLIMKWKRESIRTTTTFYNKYKEPRRTLDMQLFLWILYFKIALDLFAVFAFCSELLYKYKQRSY